MKITKNFLICGLAFFLLASFTHDTLTVPTDEFTVEGMVKQVLRFNLSALDSFGTEKIRDIRITNQRGEIKGTHTGIRGVSLKKILERADLRIEKHRELNQVYFVAIASDQYKVVYSWNEIFNTESGKQLYIITEMDGKKAAHMPERTLLLSASDLISGKRYVKCLQRIEVRKAE